MLREEDEVSVRPLRSGGDDDGDGAQVEDIAERRDVLAFPVTDRRGQHLQLKLLLPPDLGTLGLKIEHENAIHVNLRRSPSLESSMQKLSENHHTA